MQDILSVFNALRRPRLLMRAARVGVDDYRRDLHLTRHLGPARLPRPAAALLQLVEKEARLNDARRAGKASYSLADHVDVLIAMMGEARLLKATRPTQ